ncbi:MAG: alpha/beta fold hydrolase [Microthrixaceae bacterium]
MGTYTEMTFDELAAAARMVRSGHLDVATYSLGEGTGTVTYLHGFPSNALDVGPVVDRISDDATVLALDFPGFGASDKPAGHPWSIAACADAVEAMWADRSITSTVLECHDYGVSPAQELLARRAEGRLQIEITGVVWHNGGIYADLHRPTLGQQLLLDPDRGPEVAAAMTEELFFGGIEITWGTRRPLDEREVHQMWSAMNARGGSGRAHELLHYIAERRELAPRRRGAVASCELPMWFVWGDLDPVSGAHMIERVQATLPDAVIVRMADVGHWPTLEAPDECATAVRAALSV